MGKTRTPPQLQSPQLQFPFTPTDTSQPNVRNCGPLLDPGWDNWLLMYSNAVLRNKIIDIIHYGELIGCPCPLHLIIGEILQLAHNNSTSIMKDIEKRASTSQILRLPTLPAAYVASQHGLVLKQDGTWRKIHHLLSPSCRSVNDYMPQGWGTLTYTKVDDAVGAVRTGSPGQVLLNRHIADAFHHITVHSDNRWLQGCNSMGTWWWNLFLPCGYSTSPAIFDIFASALDWMLQTHKGWDHTLHYLYKFLAIFLHSATFSDAPNRYKRDFSQIHCDLGFRVKLE